MTVAQNTANLIKLTMTRAHLLMVSGNVNFIAKSIETDIYSNNYTNRSHNKQWGKC